YLSVVVHFACHIARVLLVAVEAAQTRGLVAAIGNGIPVPHAHLQSSWLVVGEEAGSQIVAKPFTHGSALLGGTEARYLVVLDGMAVFMQDDLGILRIVHAANPESQRLGHRAVVGIVVCAALNVDLD